LSYVSVRKTLCNLCGECVSACPFGAISVSPSGVSISAECQLCLQCIKKCPDGALSLAKEEPGTEEPVELEREVGPAPVAPGFEKDSPSSEVLPGTLSGIPLEAFKGILVFCEFRDGRFEPVTYELLGKAKELAEKVSQEVKALVMGEEVGYKAQDLLYYGADKVIAYEGPELRHFVASAYADVAEDAVRRELPGIFLVGATPLGRSFAPRLAARLRTGLTADCTILDIRPGGDLVQTRPAFGGNIMATILTSNSRPQMATVRYRVFERAPRRDKPLGRLEVLKLRDVGNGSLLAKVKEHLAKIRVEAESPLPQATSISDAEVIVAVGRGVRSDKDLPMFYELAERLGGILASSRPLVEKGWFPASRQVGLSGRTVRPKLYVALGISGAVQHVAGMSGSDIIIAINQDKKAPIFEVAHYGIVGDIYEIVPELLSRIGSKAAPSEV